MLEESIKELEQEEEERKKEENTASSETTEVNSADRWIKLQESCSRAKSNKLVL